MSPAAESGAGLRRFSGEVVNVDYDALIPAWFAAKRMRVSKQVFNYWRRSGKVRQAVDADGVLQVDEQGNPLYRFGDVIAADASVRRSGNSHRQQALVSR